MLFSSQNSIYMEKKYQLSLFSAVAKVLGCQVFCFFCIGEGSTFMSVLVKAVWSAGSAFHPSESETLQLLATQCKPQCERTSTASSHHRSQSRSDTTEC